MLILVGLFGTVLPAVPGVPLVFAGILMAAWVDGFTRISPLTVVVLGVLTLLSLVLEYLMCYWGAKKAHASSEALWGGAIGALVGLFGGIVGVVMGPLIGAMIGEWIARRDLVRAGHVGFASWVGMLLGSAAKLAISFILIGVFLVSYFF